jgi:ribosomal protein S18 acetylase RimI-like enzyme
VLQGRHTTLQRNGQRLRVLYPSTPGRAATLWLEPTSEPPDHVMIRDAVRLVRRTAGERCPVVTQALTNAEAKPFLQAGAELHQALVLLTLSNPRPPGRASSIPPVRRVPLRRAGQFADIDRAAFGDRMSLDAAALIDSCRVTPAARLASLRNGGDHLGFVVAGRAGDRGYLQRLAVRPEHGGKGYGRALVNHALTWMSRSLVNEILVNTAPDNQRALALYQSFGFRPRSTQLVQLEFA